jgi:inner membrane protein
MASVITHSMVGLAAGMAVPGLPKSKRFWALCALCPSIPDADTIGFRFGIHYEDMLGHRGFSHSLLFAAALGLIAASTEFRKVAPLGTRLWTRLALFFAAITATHGLLDALTDGGLGVGFFIPFSRERYFFPWTPIQVSPIGVASFFSRRGLAVLESELVYVWAPVLTLTAIVIATRRYSRRAG